jgi:hypothetical protein
MQMLKECPRSSFQPYQQKSKETKRVELSLFFARANFRLVLRQANVMVSSFSCSAYFHFDSTEKFTRLLLITIANYLTPLHHSTKRTTSITMPASFISSDEEECSISTRHSGEESSTSRSITTAHQEQDERTHYRDYLRVAAGNVQQEIHSPKGKRRGPRGGVVVPFPVKLYNMLKGVEQEGLEHIVSWQPHGRCFIVHQPKEFVEEIMPRYVHCFVSLSLLLTYLPQSNQLN